MYTYYILIYIYRYIYVCICTTKQIFIFSKTIESTVVAFYRETRSSIASAVSRVHWKLREKKHVDFARTIMQTVGAKRYFLSLAFLSFRNSAKTFAAKKRARRHSRYRRRTPVSDVCRNRALMQRRVEAEATRGNWIRDFDQFRRQRRFRRAGC